MKKKFIGAVLVAVVSAFSLAGCGDSKDDDDDEDSTPAYYQPVDDYFKGVSKSNAKLLVGSMYDKKMLENAYYDYDDMLDNYEDYMDDIEEDFEYEYGDHVRITYKVKDEKKLKDSELERYEDKYYDYYDYDAEITDGYKLDVECKISGSDDSDTEKQEMTVLKIKGVGWKLAFDSGSGMFW